ncbi:UNVERIFIED_CONTAM: KH domain-containing protein HEN4 [Sesamum radiatum]|uniref:KH domain-containing protein HEN4 n=1 Tax=Sesamum radiatum TaxID=300843 RepID=A0AAW2M2H9_SESRA
MPPFPSYMGMREFSPSRTFSHRGPPFNKFDGPGGLPPGGGFHPHDDHPPFAHDFPRPGIPPHMSERMSSAAPWGPQVSAFRLDRLKGLLYGIPRLFRRSSRRLGGFGGGNQPAIITSTTVEVVVPRFVVPAIYGEDGGCLRQIREFIAFGVLDASTSWDLFLVIISDAKITITDPKPGATETVIIISGTPEQTNAAQSLIQAFVISETEAP